MTSTAKRFVVGFSIATVLAVFLNLLPYLRTRGAYNGDGFEVIGFPFTFRRIGGYIGVHEFRFIALLADIVLGLTVAFLAGYAYSRFRRRDSV
jgi:hypothetical protein